MNIEVKRRRIAEKECHGVGVMARFQVGSQHMKAFVQVDTSGFLVSSSGSYWWSLRGGMPKPFARLLARWLGGST